MRMRTITCGRQKPVVGILKNRNSARSRAFLKKLAGEDAKQAGLLFSFGPRSRA